MRLKPDLPKHIADLLAAACSLWGRPTKPLSSFAKSPRLKAGLCRGAMQISGSPWYRPAKSAKGSNNSSRPSAQAGHHRLRQSSHGLRASGAQTEEAILTADRAVERWTAGQGQIAIAQEIEDWFKDYRIKPMIGLKPVVYAGPAGKSRINYFPASYAAKTRSDSWLATATGFGSSIGGISLGTLFGLITPIVTSPSVKYRSPPPLRPFTSRADAA